MTDTIVYDGAKIDESSQILLQILDDYNGKTDIRTLRRESDLEQSSQVHYRYENHLGDPAFDPDVDDDAAGLVLKTGTKEIAGQEMTVFRLTDDGKDFLVMHEDDVLDAVGAAEAVETIRRMKEQMDDFQNRLDNVAEEVDDTIESRYGTRFTRIQDDIEELENKIGYLETALSGRVTVEDFGEHLDDFEEVEDRLDAVHDFVRKAENTFENMEERQDVLLANQLEIGAALDEAGVDVRIVDDADDIDEERFNRLREDLTE